MLSVYGGRIMVTTTSSAGPIIPRVMNLREPNLYVTGWDSLGGPSGNGILPSFKAPESVPYTIDQKQWWDGPWLEGSVTGKPSTSFIYLGRDGTAKDYTCYIEIGEDGASTLTVGQYAGDKKPPQPFDRRSGGFTMSFFDGLHEWIWQFDLVTPPIQRIIEGAELAGEMFFNTYAPPKMVMGAVTRAGDRWVKGWGRVDGTGEHTITYTTPTASTRLPVGSLTKAFTGHLLARLVVDKALSLTERADEKIPIRAIDLATHTSGLPREGVKEIGGKPNLKYPYPLPNLLFAPGTGAQYSNVGFDLLGYQMRQKQEEDSYFDLMDKWVLTPLGLESTTSKPRILPLGDDAAVDMFLGHLFDGKTPFDELPKQHRTDEARGASGLWTTPGDILTWLQWHLQTGGEGVDAETRVVNHATYVQRDGLNPVSGLDESGHMDAMGLGWIVMMPQGDRPFILQKAGGTEGVFSFVAFSPARGVAFFIAIDAFNVAAATEMAQMVEDLIMSFAPR